MCWARTSRIAIARIPSSSGRYASVGRAPAKVATAACYLRRRARFHRLNGGVYGLRLLRQRPVQLTALVVVLAVVLALRAFQFGVLTGKEQWGYDFSFYWTAARHLNQR